MSLDFYMFFIRCLLCLLFSSFVFSDSLPIKKIQISHHAQADVDLILSGAYFPLDGFCNSEDYESILENMHLSNGNFWPIPITLPIQPSTAETLTIGEEIYLTDETNHPVAIMEIREIYLPNPQKEALSLFGCVDTNHPYIDELIHHSFCYLSGKLKRVHSQTIHELHEFILTPDEIKQWKQDQNIEILVGFQTRNPLHRSHLAAIKQSWDLTPGEKKALLLHPTCGQTQAQDIPATVRLKCYQSILPEIQDLNVKLAMLPLSMRMAGPKEALLHALVRKNYGCTHFIIGRDHAGPSVKKQDGTSFFEPTASLEMAKRHESQLGISIIPCEEFFFSIETGTYKPKNSISPEEPIVQISGTKLREMLRNDEAIPDWFSYPSVTEILKNYYQSKQGLCIYLYGLPASGKSTISKILKTKLERLYGFKKQIVLLDADAVRKNIAQELGFSKEHRSINVKRIGYLASKIVESGGVCIVSNIAPYEEDRLFNKNQISQHGQYIEIYVSTPVEICSERDPKNLYKDAKTGLVKNMTGVSRSFEPGKIIQYSISNDGNLIELNKKIDNLLKSLSL